MEVDLVQRWAAFCAKHQLKSTRQRAVLVDVVLRTKGHFTLDDIFQIAVHELPSIGYATAYRTLRLLNEAELIAPIDLGDGLSRFELVRVEDHHDHIVCTDCGRVVEFVDPRIEALQDEVSAGLGFRLVSHRMDLRGRCLLADRCPHRVSPPPSYGG